MPTKQAKWKIATVNDGRRTLLGSDLKGAPDNWIIYVLTDTNSKTGKERHDYQYLQSAKDQDRIFTIGEYRYFIKNSSLVRKTLSKANDDLAWNINKNYILIEEVDRIGLFGYSSEIALSELSDRALMPTNVAVDKEEDTDFYPDSMTDARDRVKQAIVARRGQQNFRARLLSAYGARCCVTGCNVVDVLEAAHIIPYLGPRTNHIQNGILLRADIHTLFDIGLIEISQDDYTIVIADNLFSSEYGSLRGKKIALPKEPKDWPAKVALSRRRGLTLT